MFIFNALCLLKKKTPSLGLLFETWKRIFRTKKRLVPRTLDPTTSCKCKAPSPIPTPHMLCLGFGTWTLTYLVPSTLPMLSLSILSLHHTVTKISNDKLNSKWNTAFPKNINEIHIRGWKIWMKSSKFWRQQRTSYKDRRVC